MSNSGGAAGSTAQMQEYVDWIHLLIYFYIFVNVTEIELDQAAVTENVIKQDKKKDFVFMGWSALTLRPEGGFTSNFSNPELGYNNQRRLMS